MEKINNELNIGKIAQQLLRRRGLQDPEEIRAFLYPEFYRPTEPLELPGMTEAVELVIAAINQGEQICVYGDYDADGITSTTVLVSMLRSLNAKVTYHVPDRFSEGYGMNDGVVRRLAADGIQLILTCDCGIANLAEIGLAKELGLKVVVTDHHHLPAELPDADVIVNPQQLPPEHPARNLPGVGVAYMLTKALFAALQQPGADEYLDIVALGIVADVVPLLRENRYLLQLGLEELKHTKRPGLQALIQVCNLNAQEISEEDIGFQLVPRLNATGRISSASLAVELLLSTDVSFAGRLASELDAINKQRRALGDEMFQEALALLGPTYSPRPIVLYQPHWHHGIIGIIAGRLAELYKVPVLLMSLKADGVTITGSARSTPGVHIFQVLQECAGVLGKFGGHAGAAGFSLHRDQLELFSKAVSRQLELAMDEAETSTEPEFDLEMGLGELSLDVYRELLPLAPFGEGNPTPQFLSKAVEVISQRPTTENKHLRLVLGQGNMSFPAIWWWGGDKQLAGSVDVLYNLNLNKWQGRETLQLVVTSLAEGKPDSQVAEPVAKCLQIVDLRKRETLGMELPEFSNPQFYAESKGARLVSTRDRYGIDGCESLVLFNIPPGLRVLQEMLALSRADTLALAFAPRDLESDKDFLQQLAGLVKFALTQSNGRVDLKVLATATGQMELTVAAGLNFLQAKGLIRYEYEGPERLLLSQGDRQVKHGLAESENRLRSLLAETRAFRRYMQQAAPENILQLVTSPVSYQQGLGTMD